MKTYKVLWPDGQIDLVFAKNDKIMFLSIEQLGDPSAAQIEEIELKEPLILQKIPSFRESDYKVLRVLKSGSLNYIMQEEEKILH